MNKMQMPQDLTPRRGKIQDIPDTEACIASALDTTEEQRDLRPFDDIMDKLGRID